MRILGYVLIVPMLVITMVACYDTAIQTLLKVMYYYNIEIKYVLVVSFIMSVVGAYILSKRRNSPTTARVS